MTDEGVPLAKRIVAYASHLYQAIQGGMQNVDKEILDYRLSICQSCKYYKYEHCTLCGCKCNGISQLTNKLLAPHQKCPDNPPKWTSVTESNPSGISGT